MEQQEPRHRAHNGRTLIMTVIILWAVFAVALTSILLQFGGC